VIARIGEVVLKQLVFYSLAAKVPSAREGFPSRRGGFKVPKWGYEEVVL